eukprot:scaffold23883_cov24-Tisochrysis_lutea.AAC.1
MIELDGCRDRCGWGQGLGRLRAILQDCVTLGVAVVPAWSTTIHTLRECPSEHRAQDSHLPSRCDPAASGKRRRAAAPKSATPASRQVHHPSTGCLSEASTSSCAAAASTSASSANAEAHCAGAESLSSSLSLRCACFLQASLCISRSVPRAACQSFARIATRAPLTRAVESRSAATTKSRRAAAISPRSAEATARLFRAAASIIPPRSLSSATLPVIFACPPLALRPSASAEESPTAVFKWTRASCGRQAATKSAPRLARLCRCSGQRASARA